MKKFCEFLREHAKNIIDFRKKRFLQLTKEELKSHQDAKVCYICRKRILKMFPKNKNYWTVRDHCHYIRKYRGETYNICNLSLNLPNEVPVVFHIGSNYLNY